jgi:hypothetical protein
MLMTSAVLQPLVHEWAEYRRLQLLPGVYGQDLTTEAALPGLFIQPQGDGHHDHQPQQQVQGVVAAFVPRRFGAADLSMHDAVRLSRGGGGGEAHGMEGEGAVRRR